MKDNIIDLQQYKQTLENKKNLDEGKITLDYLSLEEIEDVKVLYEAELLKLSKELKLLKAENEMLKNNIDN